MANGHVAVEYDGNYAKEQVHVVRPNKPCRPCKSWRVPPNVHTHH